ncbi:acyl-CoA thioesterase [Microbacterium excoecariae]|uniref:acyl-CoA thioesterase n=1 Tax=Microbacterium excoecariae TaxID=2715210 RepID=UPI00140BA4FD|nr:thioesterase family protein [Microbacterium excoecariae]NHI16942.1 acyl-CoA thioesterase [Microbacterium excoecariae]
MTRIHLPIYLRWGDQDAFGHVNNVTLLQHLEEARVRAFWLHEQRAQSLPTAVFDEGLRIDGSAPVLPLIARNEVDYLAPIPYRQAPLEVQMWFARLGGSSAELCYEVFVPGDAAPSARAATTLVMVSGETMRPVRLPALARRAWEPYVEEPIRFTRR